MLTKGIDVVFGVRHAQSVRTDWQDGNPLWNISRLMSKPFFLVCAIASSYQKQCSKQNLFHYPLGKKIVRYSCLLLIKSSYGSVDLSRLRSRNINTVSASFNVVMDPGYPP